MNHNDNYLSAENIYEKIEFFASLLLKADKEIVSDPRCKQASGSSIYIIDRLKNMYLLEREILCLAGIMVGLKELKDNPDILHGTISLMINKYHKLKDVFVISEMLKVAPKYQEYINDRVFFYLDELLLYLESKNPMAGHILFYQYNPLTKIEEPKVDIKNLSNSKGVIINAYLEMTFNKMTLPTLIKELPNAVKNYR